MRDEHRKTIRDNIQSVAVHNRDLPQIKIGDRVKLARKRGKFEDHKFDFSSWTDETYRVASILPGSTTFYKLDRVPTGLAEKNYIRSEHLLVTGVQKPVPVRMKGKQPRRFVAKDIEK